MWLLSGLLAGADLYALGRSLAGLVRCGPPVRQARFSTREDVQLLYSSSHNPLAFTALEWDPRAPDLCDLMDL